jgi:senataxin
MQTTRPPGTGKTSTICGLVEAYLSRRPPAAIFVHAGKSSTNTAQEAPRKILLCAPSNAAIDEVSSRVRGIGHGAKSPKVVRVGTDKGINISVKDISLDYLVDQRLNSAQTAPIKDGENERSVLRGEIDSVKNQRQTAYAELHETHDNSARTLALQDEIKRLNSRRMALTKQLDQLKDRMQSDARTLDATRRKFRQEVLREADIICTTLSGAGHELLEQFDFEMVVIDEAAQGRFFTLKLAQVDSAFGFSHRAQLFDPIEIQMQKLYHGGGCVQSAFKAQTQVLDWS